MFVSVSSLSAAFKATSFDKIRLYVAEVADLGSQAIIFICILYISLCNFSFLQCNFSYIFGNFAWQASNVKLYFVKRMIILQTFPPREACRNNAQVLVIFSEPVIISNKYDFIIKNISALRML